MGKELEAMDIRASRALTGVRLAAAVGMIAAASGAAYADALGTPAMTGPLKGNAKPTTFDAGPLGTVYVTGVLSGVALWQDNTAPGDMDSQVDVSNAQV